MKKSIIIIGATVLMALLSLSLRNFVKSETTEEAIGNHRVSEEKPELSPAFNSDTTINLDINGEEIRCTWIKIDDPAQIHLYANFSEKLTAEEAMEEKQCKALISGSFYTTESTPIGLFISEGRQIKSEIESKLFNGIFSISFDEKAKISFQSPKDNLKIGLQSGPVLIKDKNVLLLGLTNDEQARRVVASLTEEGYIVFFAFYKKDSVFSGPNLSKLPEILSAAEEEMGVKITDAINLDGGSASAFFSNGLKLSELSPIGSYFCIK